MFIPDDRKDNFTCKVHQLMTRPLVINYKRLLIVNLLIYHSKNEQKLESNDHLLPHVRQRISALVCFPQDHVGKTCLSFFHQSSAIFHKDFFRVVLHISIAIDQRHYKRVRFNVHVALAFGSTIFLPIFFDH